MEIVRAKDYGELSRKAANILASQIILKPDRGGAFNRVMPST